METWKHIVQVLVVVTVSVLGTAPYFVIAEGIKKRPHVRRAHWHHYWTGPGRTVLEVRWLEPVFVMGTEEEIDTVIHEVEGGAA